jgi:hypothetical protein
MIHVDNPRFGMTKLKGASANGSSSRIFSIINKSVGRLGYFFTNDFRSF